MYACMSSTHKQAPDKIRTQPNMSVDSRVSGLPFGQSEQLWATLVGSHDWKTLLPSQKDVKILAPLGQLNSAPIEPTKAVFISSIRIHYSIHAF